MPIELGPLMTPTLAGISRFSPRATSALILAGALVWAPVIFSGAAHAQGQGPGQAFGYAAPPSSFPSDDMTLAPADPALSDQGDGSGYVLPERLRRTIVAIDTREAPGTIIIDTPNTYLYYVLGGGQAIRYGIGVGRDGFTWSGTQSITKKAEWPDWTPPPEMIARQPYLPRVMAGGPGNPLGARAMYLGGTVYRIHGTNAPGTIGTHVSSGCIRLTNEDVSDLYSRVNVGTKVIVLPMEHRADNARIN